MKEEFLWETASEGVLFSVCLQNGKSMETKTETFLVFVLEKHNFEIKMKKRTGSKRFFQRENGKSGRNQAETRGKEGTCGGQNLLKVGVWCKMQITPD